MIRSKSLPAIARSPVPLKPMTDVELIKAKPQLCAAMIHGHPGIVDEFLSERSFNHEQCDELKAYVDTARTIAGMALDQQAAQRLLGANGQKPPAQTLRSSNDLLMPDGSPIAALLEYVGLMGEHEFDALISSAAFRAAIVLDDAQQFNQLLDGLVFSQDQTEWLQHMQHRAFASNSPKVLCAVRRIKAYQPFPGSLINQTLQASAPTTQPSAPTSVSPNTLSPFLESRITSAVMRNDLDDLKNLLASKTFSAAELDTLQTIGVTWQSSDDTAATHLLAATQQLARGHD